jgi:L-ascorbate metabolism protein UlaG (beta-lactamase superfamily)
MSAARAATPPEPAIPPEPARAADAAAGIDRAGLEPFDGRTTVGVRWLGHSTVLLDLPGFRLMTDPFLRDRLGPLRRHGPTPLPEAIGPVGFVAISHAHPDHFDGASLRSIVGDPLVVVPRGLGRMVRRLGLRPREVVVGETVPIAPDWTITAVPARHWRWPISPGAAAIGYLIEGPSGSGIYFAGDTAPYRAMREFADRVDLALLPVGSWGPHLTPGHLSPRSAAEVARELGARVAVPIHCGTLFPPRLERVFGHRLTQPATRFADWIARVSPATEVHALQPGDSAVVRL